MELTKQRMAGLLVLLVIGVAALLAAPGILAYFSSTQTSATNTFEAGTIVLAVDDSESWTGTIDADFQDLKPGMNKTGTVILKNTGTNPFDVWMKITDVTTTDGVNTAPEALETSAYDIDSVIRYILTVDGTQEIEYDDLYTISTGAHNMTAGDVGAGIVLKDSWIYLGEMASTDPDTSMAVSQTFSMEPKTTNWAQGDTMSFKVVFYAQQNEADFEEAAPTPELAGHGRT